MTMTNSTHADVAKFMAEQLKEKKYLYQEDIVWEIQNLFGEQFVYENENGNLAIDKTVLRHFRTLTPDAIWEGGERMWRARERYDAPNKRGQD
jgi:hypothetical protein